MALPIFGAQAAVSIVNRALSNSSPAHNVYLNQVSNAGVTASSEYAFAGQLGASYAVGKTPAQLAEMILANVGISATTIPAESYDILLAAGTDYIAFHGTQNIGIIALQFGQIISGLENDVTFGNAAKAWNAEVLAAYNYSTNPANGTTQTGEGVPGNSNIVLTVGQDNLAGSAADDTFKANVSQNSLGQQVNTLGSGDILEGGAGFDTLDAKITNGSFVGSSNTESQPIQPETNSIEYIKLQAVLANASKDNDTVFVNAKDMVGVKTISSNYSDASLTIMNMTTKGSSQLTDLTVNMSYTGNNDSSWDQSNFKVLFDQDYLTPEKTLGTASVDFLAMNEDNYDASNGENPLTGVFFRTLNFTLNGVEYNLAAYLGEDATGAGAEINTYADFLAAVTAGLVALKADHPENAALQTVQASFGRTFTTDISPTTLELREGTAIRLTADGQTNGVANTLYVDSTDLEVARAGMATVPNNNRYEIADATPPVEGSKLGINVELEKVGLAGDGGALVIGSMNKGDDSNTWNGANTTVSKTTNGINEFYVTVKGNADKSSSLSELRSTNNQLKVVTVKTDAAQTGTFANLTIGNSNTDLAVGLPTEGSYQNALKDVKIFDASAFKGDLSLKAALTSEVTAKYLDLKDKAPADAAADNAAFIYTGGTGNDKIDLQVSAANLAKPGTATREDMSVNVVGGAGNDQITLTVVVDKTDDLAGAGNWYTNQALNANLRINAGEGNDIIRTPGWGNVIIDAGTGDDTVYSDNMAGKAAWVFNSTNTLAADLAAVAPTAANETQFLYKGVVNVTFAGFAAKADVATGANYAVTQLDINQAIKKAINDDAVLSKLFVAEDGPASTLVVKSLIDGAVVVGDLGYSVTAAAIAATEVAAADAAFAKFQALNPASLSTAGADANAANALTAADKSAVAKQLATDVDLIGADSAAGTDNVITLGAGNDVVVLSTSTLADEKLVYSGYDLGKDSIVNFTAGVVAPDDGFDKLDFSAYLTSLATATAVLPIATTLNVDATVEANSVTVLTGNAFSATDTFAGLTAAKLLASLNTGGTAYAGLAPATLNGAAAGFVGEGKAVVLVENNLNVGEFAAFELTFTGTSAGEFTAVKAIGVLDFGDAITFDASTFA